MHSKASGWHGWILLGKLVLKEHLAVKILLNQACHGSVGDHHGHQEEIGVIELINGVTTQEGAGEEASTSLQKGGKVPRRLHCDQTLPGMQVPGLPEVVKVVIAIITCTDMVMMVMMKMMTEGSGKTTDKRQRDDISV